MSQQLDGWLCPILLLGWHVQVVDEYHYVGLTLLGAVIPLTSSNTDFPLYGLLHEVCIGLSGEDCLKVRVLDIIVVGIELIDDIDGLACPRGSTEQEMYFVSYTEVEEVIITDGIVGGYE